MRPGLRGGARNGTATTTVTASRNDFHRPPQPIVVESIGTIRSKGAAVESICLEEEAAQRVEDKVRDTDEYRKLRALPQKTQKLIAAGAVLIAVLVLAQCAMVL